MGDSRASKGLALVHERIRASRVPRARAGESVVLATWNVRELGRTPRREDAIAMIAAILGRFSLTSLVELRRDTTDLERILERLGPRYRVLYSEPLDDPGGNGERACFLYDTRFVTHTGLVSVVHGERRRVGREYVTPHWWRPPYMAGFRAGETSFVLATAHVRWGGPASGRLAELRALATWAEGQARRAKSPTPLVLAGDMNIPSTASPLYRALTARGLTVPEALLGAHGTNLAENKRYDHILHLPALAARFTERAGVVDFFGDDGRGLFPRGVSREGLTRQMSDHLPLWAELRVG